MHLYGLLEDTVLQGLDAHEDMNKDMGGSSSARLSSRHSQNAMLRMRHGISLLVHPEPTHLPKARHLWGNTRHGISTLCVKDERETPNKTDKNCKREKKDGNE